MTEPDLFTLRELAALLRVGEKTAYTLAQGGDLLGFKLGGQWRFQRADFGQWMDVRRRAASRRDEGDGSDAH